MNDSLEMKVRTNGLNWNKEKLFLVVVWYLFIPTLLSTLKFIGYKIGMWGFHLYVVNFVTLFAFVLIQVRFKLKYLGICKFDKEKLALGFALIIMYYIARYIYIVFLMKLGHLPDDPALGVSKNFNIIFLFLLVVIISPIVQEIILRGFLFSGLSKFYGWKKSALFISLVVSLFSIGDGIFQWIPTVFLLNYSFAYLYHESKSLIPVIFTHSVFNLISFASYYGN